ncbi:MAG: Zinicin-like metallopeptidase, partial [Friedmanniella sp.]|nr:Zinicin-like metallopeptidase [Friedmanniella sp.]
MPDADLPRRDRRDRHGRGIRGPLAVPTALSPRRAAPPRPSTKSDFFHDAVHGA